MADERSRTLLSSIDVGERMVVALDGDEDDSVML